MAYGKFEIIGQKENIPIGTPMYYEGTLIGLTTDTVSLDGKVCVTISNNSSLSDGLIEKISGKNNEYVFNDDKLMYYIAKPIKKEIKPIHEQINIPPSWNDISWMESQQIKAAEEIAKEEGANVFTAILNSVDGVGLSKDASTIDLPLFFPVNKYHEANYDEETDSHPPITTHGKIKEYYYLPDFLSQLTKEFQNISENMFIFSTIVVGGNNHIINVLQGLPELNLLEINGSGDICITSKWNSERKKEEKLQEGEATVFLGTEEEAGKAWKKLTHTKKYPHTEKYNINQYPSQCVIAIPKVSQIDTYSWGFKIYSKEAKMEVFGIRNDMRIRDDVGGSYSNTTAKTLKDDINSCVGTKLELGADIQQVKYLTGYWKKDKNVENYDSLIEEMQIEKPVDIGGRSFEYLDMD